MFWKKGRKRSQFFYRKRRSIEKNLKVVQREETKSERNFFLKGNDVDYI